MVQEVKRSDQPGPILGISFLGDDVTGCGGGVWLSSSGGRLREKEEEEEIRRRAPFTPDKRPSGKTGVRFEKNGAETFVRVTKDPRLKSIF